VVRAPNFHAYSQYVLPRPEDWPPNVHVTGYWFLDTDAGWTPPADLVEFLAAGEPPVYVGFGSMSDRNPEKNAGIVLEALAETGQRGVLHAGWGGLQAENIPDTVFAVEDIPHDWLFPRMAAVVHHGGAGTTAAGLRAGVPNITVPFFADQPFWGKCINRLGVGPPPIARDQLTPSRLANAIRQAVSDQEMQQRAGVLGEKIRGEDGVGTAVELIEVHLKT
jgi:sterol 3beta-glucosyltransferase